MMNTLSSDEPRGQGRGLRMRYWIEGALIVAFWSTIALLRVTQNTFDPLGPGPPGGSVPPGQTLYTMLEYGLWLFATPVVFWLASRFSLGGPYWPRHLALHVVAAVTASVFIDLASHALWNAVGEGRPRPVSIAAVVDNFHFLPELLLYLVVLATGLARAYFLRYRERVDEAARLRAEAAELQAHSADLQAQLAEARLQALRMQLNPHFLFNTLNTVSADLGRDPAGARRMIARLSELLRYTLAQSEVREVSLEQELDFIDGYLEIQRVRLDDRLDVRTHIAPEALHARVPTLILQPLVENAIKHGISHREEGGRIELRAWREGERLHLVVRDDGPGLGARSGDGAPSESHGIGLRNTRDRLRSLYGAAQHLALEPAEGGGLAVHITVPYHTDTDLYTSAPSPDETAGLAATGPGRKDPRTP